MPVFIKSPFVRMLHGVYFSASSEEAGTAADAHAAGREEGGRAGCGVMSRNWGQIARLLHSFEHDITRFRLWVRRDEQEKAEAEQAEAHRSAATAAAARAASDPRASSSSSASQREEEEAAAEVDAEEAEEEEADEEAMVAMLAGLGGLSEQSEEAVRHTPRDLHFPS